MMDRRPLTRILTFVMRLCLFIGLLTPSAYADSSFYDLSPLSDKSPAVKVGFNLLNTASEELVGQTKAVEDALQGLNKFQASTTDSLDKASVAWLRGSLLRHVGKVAESRSEFEVLTRGSESLRDLGYVELYDLVDDSNDLEASIEKLLEIGPWVPQYAAHYKKAILFLIQKKRHKDAAEAVSKILDRSLSPSLRQGLEKRLVELWSTLGLPGKAKALLMRTWWGSKSEKKRTKAWNTLRKLGAKPSFYAQLARVVFKANRGTVKGARKKLRMFKGIGSHQKRMYRWGLSVLNRFRSDLRPLTLKKLKRMRKHIPSKAQPYFIFGHALVLKSAKQPLDAAKLLHEVAERFPEHHLAAEAALEAGRLLTDYGENVEGMGAYQRAIEMAPRGAFHREGLWRVGLAAFLSGEYKRAASMMGDIVARYGGEREALGILWAEKAGYWRA